MDADLRGPGRCVRGIPSLELRERNSLVMPKKTNRFEHLADMLRLLATVNTP